MSGGRSKPSPRATLPCASWLTPSAAPRMKPWASCNGVCAARPAVLTAAFAMSPVFPTGGGLGERLRTRTRDRGRNVAAQRRAQRVAEVDTALVELSLRSLELPFLLLA